MNLFLIIIAEIVTLSVAFPLADQSDLWEALPKTPSGKQFIDISAKGNELWAIDADKAVYRFDSSNRTWTLKELKVEGGAAMSGKPRTIGASPDGFAVISTDGSFPDSGTAYQWNEGTKTWKPLPIAYAVQMNAMSNLNVFAVAQDYATYVYSDVYKPVLKREVVSAQWAALGTSDDRWFIDRGNKKLYRWNKGAIKYDEIPPPWQPNVPEKIDAQCPGRAVLLTHCGRVFTYSGGTWTQLPIQNAVRATVNYKSVIAITSDGKTLSLDWEQACEDGSGIGGTGQPCNCPQ